MRFKILNSKEQKQIWNMVEAQWGIEEKPDGVLLRNAKNKIFLTNRDVEQALDQNLHIDTVGLYILEQPNETEVRLSIEGTQLLGPNAKKNITELNKDQARIWLKGQNVPTNVETKTFQIIRHGKDYMGCGKSDGQELRNYMPKTRRILATD